MLNLSGKHNHRIALTATLGMPEHTQLALQFLTTQESIVGVVHAKELMILCNDCCFLYYGHPAFWRGFFVFPSFRVWCAPTVNYPALYGRGNWQGCSPRKTQTCFSKGDILRGKNIWNKLPILPKIGVLTLQFAQSFNRRRYSLPRQWIAQCRAVSTRMTRRSAPQCVWLLMSFARCYWFYLLTVFSAFGNLASVSWLS